MRVNFGPFARRGLFVFSLLGIYLLSTPAADAFSSPGCPSGPGRSLGMEYVHGHARDLSKTATCLRAAMDDYPEAGAVAQNMGTTPTRYTMDDTVDSMLSRGELVKAHSLLLQSMEEDETNTGISSRPSVRSFEKVILAHLRRAHECTDGAAAGASLGESLLDQMELLYQPRGALYRKLIYVLCAVPMREDLSELATGDADNDADLEQRELLQRQAAFKLRRARMAAQKALRILDRMESLFRETGIPDLMPGLAQFKSVAVAWKALGTVEAEDIVKHVEERRDDLYSKVGRLVGSENVGRKIIRSHKDVLEIVDQLKNDKLLAKKLVYQRYNRRTEEGVEGDEIILNQGHPGLATTTYNYNLILAALARNGRVWAGQRAEAILYFMVDQTRRRKNHFATPDIISINTVIDAWARTPSPDSATRAENILVMLDAWHKEGLLHKVQATTSSYNSIINAWCLSGRRDTTENAERILTLLEDNDTLSPDSWSYASVINAYAKESAHNFDAANKAEELLKRMHQKYQAYPEESVAPSVRCFNAVLDAHANSKEKDAGKRAMKLLSIMEDFYELGKSDFQPDLYSYNLALKALSKARNEKCARQAMELLDKMEKWSKNGNERVRPDIVTFNTVIGAFAKSENKGAYEQAERLYERMKASNIKPDAVTVASIINSIARSGDRNAVRRAESIIRSAKEERISLDTAVYNSLLNCLARSANRYASERAEEVLGEMEKEIVYGKGSIRPDVRSYTSTITALSRCRDRLAPQRAMDILDRMEKLAVNDQGVLPNTYTYTSAIRCWARSRDEHKAKKAQGVLNRMEEQYRRGNVSARPNVVAHNVVLNACAYSASRDMDTATMEEAFKIACLTMEELRSSDYLHPDHISYSNFLDVCMRLMPDGDLKSDLVANMFTRCCREGNTSLTIVRKLRGAVSAERYKSLMKGSSPQNLPNGWTRRIRT
jgi:pentatricopeptide repeat protein